MQQMKKSQHLTIRIDEFTRMYLEKQSDVRNLTVADYIRELIELDRITKMQNGGENR